MPYNCAYAYDDSDVDSSDASSSLDDCQRLCEGVNRFGNDCAKPAKSGYDFCCAHHDPSVQRTFASNMLSISNLRYERADQLVRIYGEEDFYRAHSLLPDEPQFVELDHIVELQCFAHAFNEICERRQRCGESTSSLFPLKALVRETIASDNANLCLTRKTTNQLKGTAVWKFIDDHVTGHRGAACLHSYLAREENAETGKVLRRSDMRSISRKMGHAVRWCQTNLNQGCENVSNAAIAELNQQLDVLYDDMVLG